MARIEREQRRKSGERVDMLHPDYPIQVVEDEQEGFNVRIESISEAVLQIEDPIIKGVFEQMTGLLDNMREVLGDARMELALRQKRETQEYRKVILGGINTPRRRPPGGIV